MQVVYSVIQKNKDSNSLDASTKADIDMRQKSSWKAIFMESRIF